LAYACSACDRKEPHQASDRFNHAWYLYTLQVAGYPFKQDDLSMDEWLMIAELKSELEAMKVPNG